MDLTDFIATTRIPIVSTKKGVLYVIATPIGHLDDLSARAIATLKQCDLVACEDTRKTRQLINAANITVPCCSYYEQNEKQRAVELADKIASGMTVALVSDAGTPTISDPGFRLVRQCRSLELPVIPLPGPCAMITALSASGLPSDGFLFLGFLPVKRIARQNLLKNYLAFPYTLIFHESCHRIQRCLCDLQEVFGPERVICVARELTKIYETFYVGTIVTVIPKIIKDKQKGEFVVLLAKEKYSLSTCPSS